MAGDPEGAVHPEGGHLDLGPAIVMVLAQEDLPHCLAGPRVSVERCSGRGRDGLHGHVELAGVAGLATPGFAPNRFCHGYLDQLLGRRAVTTGRR
jgi:hypothetical protein